MERSGARWPVLDWPVLDWPTLDWPALDWRAAGWLAGESPDPSSRALARPIRKQIGRAPCRGRGEISGVAVSLKKKQNGSRHTGDDVRVVSYGAQAAATLDEDA